MAVYDDACMTNNEVGILAVRHKHIAKRSTAMSVFPAHIGGRTQSQRDYSCAVGVSNVRVANFIEGNIHELTHCGEHKEKETFSKCMGCEYGHRDYVLTAAEQRRLVGSHSQRKQGKQKGFTCQPARGKQPCKTPHALDDESTTKHLGRLCLRPPSVRRSPLRRLRPSRTGPGRHHSTTWHTTDEQRYQHHVVTLERSAHVWNHVRHHLGKLQIHEITAGRSADLQAGKQIGVVGSRAASFTFVACRMPPLTLTASNTRWYAVHNRSTIRHNVCCKVRCKDIRTVRYTCVQHRPNTANSAAGHPDFSEGQPSQLWDVLLLLTAGKSNTRDEARITQDVTHALDKAPHLYRPDHWPAGVWSLGASRLIFSPVPSPSNPIAMFFLRHHSPSDSSCASCVGPAGASERHVAMHVW